MMPQIAIVQSSELGLSWCPRDHIKLSVKLSHWEELQDIVRRRRYHVKALVKLDEEEQRIRKVIEEQ